MTQPNKHTTLDQPATYRIRITGRLNQDWSDNFGGLALISETEAGGQTITLIEGTILDQAQLHGLLSTIRDLGLTLLSVERLEKINLE